MIRNQQPDAGNGCNVDGKSDPLDAGAIIAAISTALFEATEDKHDIESTIRTGQKVSHRNPPWNSKIHGLRDSPGKNLN